MTVRIQTSELQMLSPYDSGLTHCPLKEGPGRKGDYNRSPFLGTRVPRGDMLVLRSQARGAT